MGSSLRILSANLASGRADSEAFAELLRRCEPDVVAVQELTPGHADVLARILPHGEMYPNLEYTGMGIALRRPGRLARVPLYYRDACVAQLETADWPDLPRALEILNVHISAPHTWPPWSQTLRRHRQVSGLLSYTEAEPDRTRAIVGDFNATPLWPVYHRIARRFDDLASLHAGARGGRPAATWPRRPRGPLIRIDHAFGSGLVAESVEVVDLPGSDHYALVLDLTLA